MPEDFQPGHTVTPCRLRYRLHFRRTTRNVARVGAMLKPDGPDPLLHSLRESPALSQPRHLGYQVPLQELCHLRPPRPVYLPGGDSARLALLAPGPISRTCAEVLAGDAWSAQPRGAGGFSLGVRGSPNRAYRLAAARLDGCPGLCSAHACLRSRRPCPGRGPRVAAPLKDAISRKNEAYGQGPKRPGGTARGPCSGLPSYSPPRRGPHQALPELARKHPGDVGRDGE